VSYTPLESGAYHVTLTVNDTAGQSASNSLTFNVEPKKTNGVFPANVTKPRIMLLGDSLTGGSGCWKKLFAAKLKSNGKTNYEFVGTRKDDCGGGIQHEGHSCAKASDFIKDTYNNQCSGQENGLARLLKTNKPDMVMMTLGTNDAWGVPGVNSILQSYTKLIEIMRQHNPNMVIAVAQIPKMRPDNNQTVYKQVEDLYKAVPAWAQPLNQPNSPVIVVDLWTNFNITDTTDGDHPSDAVGHPKVADNWYKVVGEYLW
jgi:acyl-CoA thioesterase I